MFLTKLFYRLIFINQSDSQSKYTYFIANKATAGPIITSRRNSQIWVWYSGSDLTRYLPCCWLRMPWEAARAGNPFPRSVGDIGVVLLQ